jgi:hypothetical protein
MQRLERYWHQGSSMKTPPRCQGLKEEQAKVHQRMGIGYHRLLRSWMMFDNVWWWWW